MSNDSRETRPPAIVTASKGASPAPPPHNNPFGGLSQRFRGQIRRQQEAQRAWDDDPANRHEGDFWFDVEARKFEWKMKEDELTVVPAVGAQAVAARNHEQRLIKAERIAIE